MTKNRVLPSRPVTLMFVLSAFCIGGARPGLAGITCGNEPEQVAEAAAQVKDQAALILQAPANNARRALVLAKRRELREKYAEIDPGLLDHDLLWVVCQNIAKDRTMAGSQQFERYAELYRLMSEPIAKPASHE
jgi:hypothetical protein